MMFYRIWGVLRSVTRRISIQAMKKSDLLLKRTSQLVFSSLDTPYFGTRSGIHTGFQPKVILKVFYRLRGAYNAFRILFAVTQKRNDGAFPVLFVHGHLGSYEQMRSMASETAKELSRRYRKGDDIRWIDWYAVDFDGEPSGLEPRLLVRLLRAFLGINGT